MKIDLLRYKSNLNTIRTYLQVNQNMSLNDKVTNYSVATHVPLIVVAYYIMKIEGASDELQTIINRLMAFYKYDELVGIEELMDL